MRACRVVDFGSVYASKTFRLRDGRRVLLGWVYETAAGCESQCSTGTNFTDSLVSPAFRSVQYFAWLSDLSVVAWKGIPLRDL